MPRRHYRRHARSTRALVQAAFSVTLGSVISSTQSRRIDIDIEKTRQTNRRSQNDSMATRSRTLLPPSILTVTQRHQGSHRRRSRSRSRKKSQNTGYWSQVTCIVQWHLTPCVCCQKVHIISSPKLADGQYF